METVRRAYSLRETAEQLGISVETMRRIVRRQLIAVTRVGARIRIMEGDLEAFLERSRMGSQFE